MHNHSRDEEVIICDYVFFNNCRGIVNRRQDYTEPSCVRLPKRKGYFLQDFQYHGFNIKIHCKKDELKYYKYYEISLEIPDSFNRFRSTIITREVALRDIDVIIKIHATENPHGKYIVPYKNRLYFFDQRITDIFKLSNGFERLSWPMYTLVRGLVWYIRFNHGEYGGYVYDPDYRDFPAHEYPDEFPWEFNDTTQYDW